LVLKNLRPVPRCPQLPRKKRMSNAFISYAMNPVAMSSWATMYVAMTIE
jgi:hypothetical protein